MEKVFFVMSGSEKHDGLDKVNNYLENGWKFKSITSQCCCNEYVTTTTAYIVLEKED